MRIEKWKKYLATRTIFFYMQILPSTIFEYLPASILAIFAILRCRYSVFLISVRLTFNTQDKHQKRFIIFYLLTKLWNQKYLEKTQNIQIIVFSMKNEDIVNIWLGTFMYGFELVSFLCEY